MNNGYGGYGGGYGGPPPGYGAPHAPQPSPRRDNTLKGTLGTAAAFVALAAIVIPLGMNSDSGGGPDAGALPEAPSLELPDGADLGADGGGFGDPAGPDGGGGGEGGSTPMDPLSEAFFAVQAGDCLANYQTDNSGTWNDETPQRVDCAADDAYLKVTQTTGDYEICDDGWVSNGTTWNHSWTDEETWETTSHNLCVVRQYRVGECLMSEQSGSGDSAVMTTGLMSAINCSAAQVPAPYNQIMQVSSVPAANGDYSGDVCRQGANDYNTYWYQNLDGGDGDVLCMTVYGS
ncbi:LppU/SCO3897 family protein [Streptomyces harbinensis]